MIRIWMAHKKDLLRNLFTHPSPAWKPEARTQKIEPYNYDVAPFASFMG